MANSTASASGVGTSLPSGSVIPFAGENIPSGWLLCNGQQVSRSGYRDLFNAIGTAWGEGDGSSTFHVPDMVGCFLRGNDPTNLRDPNDFRTITNTGGNALGVGSFQADAMSNHYHQVTNAGTYSTQSGADNWVGGPNSGSWTLNSSNPIGTNASSETRPKNVSVNYIVKV